MQKKSGNAGWVDSSPRADQMIKYRNYLTDEEYLASLVFKGPLIDFITDNFKIDPYNPLSYMKFPVLVLGVQSTPLAIEISQWSYPTTLVVKTYADVRNVQANSTKFGGEIDDLRHFNYFKACPASKIIVWVDDDLEIPRERIKKWLEYLREQSYLVVAALKKSKETLEIIDRMKGLSVKKSYGNYFLVISYR
jgi:hypothetical protein